MGRNLRTRGLILHVYRVAEYHKGLVILSPEHGVLHATAFGAYKGKSRLSGVTEIFIEGDMRIYHDPVKDRYKVSEIYPVCVHEELRGQLERYYTALFWSELIMKSFAGGGNFTDLYDLAHRSLQLLDTAERIDQLLIQFVWRFLDLTGFQPDILNCGECGRQLERNESLFMQKGQLVGEGCGYEYGALRMTPAARNYLLHTSGVSLEKTTGVSIPSIESSELKRLLLAYVEDVIGYPLMMLQKGLV